ncbi:unnamed protein product [Coffea canephora]|uniref:DH200=94 genomic scaffold, scaffold_3206 n=1 Tax=Coffea canephora TaxID=49390 RepID=A0A068VNK2_COFCA|nr:unnamed protein product [Coffea canephora]
MTLKECEKICLKNYDKIAALNFMLLLTRSWRMNLQLFIICKWYFMKSRTLGLTTYSASCSSFKVLKRQRKLAEQLSSAKSDNKNLDLSLFDLKTIAQATNNFSRDNKLGKGRFGPVYNVNIALLSSHFWGTFEEGQAIAVKQLSEYSNKGLDELKNEVKYIAELQHRNLVKLLGCCIQGEEKICAFTKKLIRRVLVKMLYDSRLTIIHRDLKTSNILLNSEMKQKISLLWNGQNFLEEVRLKQAQKEFGYMSSEYAIDGVFSTKLDVFSFGILVLEVVIGREQSIHCIIFLMSSTNHHNSLLNSQAWLLYKNGKFQELIDDHLSPSCYLSEVIRSIHVGLVCVQQSLDDRPSMLSMVLISYLSLTSLTISLIEISFLNMIRARKQTVLAIDSTSHC